MSFQITDYFSWDYHLNEAVKTFKRKAGRFPNIAIGNSSTLGQIDVIANVLGEASIEAQGSPKLDKWGFRGLSGFSGTDYYVEFARDESIGKNTLTLVYDGNPQFD